MIFKLFLCFISFLNQQIPNNNNFQHQNGAKKPQNQISKLTQIIAKQAR